MKKDRRHRLIKEIDRLHPIFIKRRGDYRCVTCGGLANAQCGHLLTRAFLSTRWDIREDGNCHVQCAACNMWHEHHPDRYTLWYLKKFGQEKYEALVRLHNTQKKYTIGELEELAALLKGAE